MNQKVRFLVQFAILAAIEAIFCFTPLGSLPAFGPIVATLAMIPVILTGLLLGTGAGTAMGALAGCFSFLVWTFGPLAASPTAFVFSPIISGHFGSLLICFVPRILVGTAAGALYKLFSKTMPKKNYLGMVIASFAASMVNTIGVMGGIWIFFGSQYSSVVGKSILLIIGTTVLTSGIPEAVVSAVLCPAACKSVNAALKKRV